VPGERARALQAAFVAVHKDKQLLQEAEKAGLDISPVDAAEVHRTIKKVAETPIEMLRSIEKLIGGR
jgi:hypothetical protein